MTTPDKTPEAAKRLRQAANHGTMERDPRSLVATSMLMEVATDIETLAAENAALRAQLQAARQNNRNVQNAREFEFQRAEKLRANNDRLRGSLMRWQSYGCPDCHGDCGSANPPVSCCIMQETRAALDAKPCS